MTTSDDGFVLHVDVWGHGNSTFCLIAERPRMVALVAALAAALDGKGTEPPEAPSLPGEPTTLWSGPLTRAGKPDPRTRLAFQITADLAPYRVRKRAPIRCLLFATVAIALLYFAVVGAKATFGG